MQDDSGLNSPGRKLQRSQSSISDSFRMAASVLQGGSGPSRRAQNLVIPNIRLKDKQDYRKQPECQASQSLVDLGSTTVESVRTLSVPPAHLAPSISRGLVTNAPITTRTVTAKYSKSKPYGC